MLAACVTVQNGNFEARRICGIIRILYIFRSNELCEDIFVFQSKKMLSSGCFSDVFFKQRKVALTDADS